MIRNTALSLKGVFGACPRAKHRDRSAGKRKPSGLRSFERLESRTLFSATPISHFVYGAYLDSLARRPDAEGYLYWTSTLAAGASQEQVAASLLTSPEHHAQLVAAQYDRFLRRSPDAEGLDWWVGQMQAGATLEQVQTALLSSGEYYDRAGGTDGDYIYSLFNDLCQRSPQDSEWEGGHEVLESGPAALAGVLIAAGECQALELDRLYQDTVGRGIDEEGLGYWLDQMSAGASASQVRLALMGSQEYADRCLYSGDAVIDWNLTAFDALRADRMRPGPGQASRSLAMVHGAVFDAVRAIEGDVSAYPARLWRAEGASSEAAASAAAYQVLSHLYPRQQELFDARLSASLAEIPDGEGEHDGLIVGFAAADAMIAARAGDHADDPSNYTQGNGPGKWRSDPLNPGQKALGPGWGHVAPFVLDDAGQFAPPPPPEMSSSEYAQAFDEVQSLGAADSQTRTEDQTEIGIFWGYDRPGLGTPPVLYNQIVQAIALGQANSILDNARLFAVVNLAMADAGIACWETKYEYDFWRPVTAIREADTDGNPATDADPDWTPLGAPGGGLIPDFTPPFPAYTSGHATFGAAALQAVLRFYDTAQLPFVIGSDELPGVYRSYDNLNDPIDENGQSRIYLGIHWQFDNQKGQVAGRAIADYVFENWL